MTCTPHFGTHTIGTRGTRAAAETSAEAAVTSRGECVEQPSRASTRPSRANPCFSRIDSASTTGPDLVVGDWNCSHCERHPLHGHLHPRPLVRLRRKPGPTMEAVVEPVEHEEVER